MEEIHVYERKQCANCAWSPMYDGDECPFANKKRDKLMPVFVDEYNIELLCPDFVCFEA